MMIISGDNNMNGMNGVHRMPHERLEAMRPILPHERLESMRPIPPHERKSLMNVEFDQSDWTVLKEVFGDEDTALAAAEIIKAAPPEIQILAAQLIDIIEEV